MVGGDGVGGFGLDKMAQGGGLERRYGINKGPITFTVVDWS